LQELKKLLHSQQLWPSPPLYILLLPQSPRFAAIVAALAAAVAAHAFAAKQSDAWC